MEALGRFANGQGSPRCRSVDRLAALGPGGLDPPIPGPKGDLCGSGLGKFWDCRGLPKWALPAGLGWGAGQAGFDG